MKPLVPDAPRVRIAEAASAAEVALAQAIRLEVFSGEQGIDRAAEIDGLDDEARHLLAWAGDEAVGTLRVRILDDGRCAKIERVAVRAAFRGRRCGEALVEAAIALACAAGAREIRLHAQEVAQSFYRRLGFTPEGAVFIEDGIPHVLMRRAPD